MDSESPREREAKLVGANLRAIREARGMSQTDLYKKSGIAQNQISRWETGKQLPELLSLRALARAIGCEVHDFYAPIVDDEPNGDELPPVAA